jgi:hypothetical protein
MKAVGIQLKNIASTVEKGQDIASADNIDVDAGFAKK